MFCHNPFKILFSEASRIQTARILHLVKDGWLKQWIHITNKTIRGNKKSKKPPTLRSRVSSCISPGFHFFLYNTLIPWSCVCFSVHIFQACLNLFHALHQRKSYIRKGKKKKKSRSAIVLHPQSQAPLLSSALQRYLLTCRVLHPAANSELNFQVSESMILPMKKTGRFSFFYLHVHLSPKGLPFGHHSKDTALSQW